MIKLSDWATEEQRQSFERAIAHLKQSEAFRELWNELYYNEAGEMFIIRIVDDNTNFDLRNGTTINWNPTRGLIMGDGITIQSAAMGLAHEMGHAAQFLEGLFTSETSFTDGVRARLEADNLLRFETPIARQLGEPIRAHYHDHSGFHIMNNSTHHRIRYNPFWNFRSQHPMTININWR